MPERSSMASVKSRSMTGIHSPALVQTLGNNQIGTAHNGVPSYSLRKMISLFEFVLEVLLASTMVVVAGRFLRFPRPQRVPFFATRSQILGSNV